VGHAEKAAAAAAAEQMAANMEAAAAEAEKAAKKFRKDYIFKDKGHARQKFSKYQNKGGN
jgi:hypothetical protein